MRSYLFVPMFFFACANAAAQAPNARAEAFAGGGLCRMGGDEGSLGRGTCLVAGLGFRIAGNASVEVDLLRAHHERDIAGGPLEGSATGVFGNLVYHFGRGRARLFTMASVGVLDSNTTHTFPSATGVNVISSDATDFAWGGGAGVEAFVDRRFSFRPQFRMIFSETTGVMGLFSATVAVGYHW